MNFQSSGEFIARIWNQTTTVGTASTLEQFMEACQDLFGQGRPCVGCIQEEEDDQATPQDYLISHTPVRRRVSKACHKVLGGNSIEIIWLEFDSETCQN